MEIKYEERDDLHGPGLYIIDEDKFNLGRDDVELHSRLKIPKNYNFIGQILEMNISYWGKNNGNLWT